MDLRAGATVYIDQATCILLSTFINVNVSDAIVFLST